MITSILSKLGLMDEALETGGKDERKHVRHPAPRAEVFVGSRSYSLQDWSLGGLSFENKMDARVSAGDKISVVLRFRLPHGTVEVVEQAMIVRTGVQEIAARFLSLSTNTRRRLMRVMDSMNAQDFVESQIESQVA